jgi:dihydrofolate reductase
MARIVGYIAASLDGFIADADEGLKWLTERKGVELGEFDYNLFIKRIRTVVMGRTTYEWMKRQGMEWPYRDQRSIVVTSHALDTSVGNVELRSDVEALIAELRALDDGDVWMLGGGKLQMAFLERGALDELEVYVISTLLGGGYPLFPPTGFFDENIELLAVNRLGAGCARLHYRLG